MSSSKIRKSVLSILRENKLLSLATFDVKNKQPCVCSAYYVYDDDLNLYIWTGPNTKHAKNIVKNPKVAVNIANTKQKWGSLLRGLQIEGKARRLKTSEILTPAKLYVKRYAGVAKFIKKLTDFHLSKLESKMYKIEINKIKVFDEKIFGKEEFKEIKP